MPHIYSGEEGGRAVAWSGWAKIDRWRWCWSEPDDTMNHEATKLAAEWTASKMSPRPSPKRVIRLNFFCSHSQAQIHMNNIVLFEASHFWELFPKQHFTWYTHLVSGWPAMEFNRTFSDAFMCKFYVFYQQNKSIWQKTSKQRRHKMPMHENNERQKGCDDKRLFYILTMFRAVERCDAWKETRT